MNLSLSSSITPSIKPVSRTSLSERYGECRRFSESICESLENEDYIVQPFSEVSPPKWHLAHTTWFFEELILVPYAKGYKRYNDGFALLFNSYYKSAGKHWLQSQRGQLSRPTVAEIYAYRHHVDKCVTELLDNIENSHCDLERVMEIGLHHEQQHQELLFMDIKSILAMNPEWPVWKDVELPKALSPFDKWQDFDEGLYHIGCDETGFAYDNERPRHKVFIYPFSMRESSITNGEFLEFINAGGYGEAKYWLSLGWDWVVENAITKPLYWQLVNGQWYEFTLHGLVALDLNAPVTHISYFEADAFANWLGFRLPTEFELEIYLKQFNENYQAQSTFLHPTQPNEALGQNWMWSQSHYSAYPGFKPFNGMLSEYNGKFMCNQFVLRGACVATPENHYRHTYRNFYQPHQRWMFSGIRLAKGDNQ